MGKTVKHHKVVHKHKSEPSKFSLFSHKIAGVFKEIVEAPEEVETPVETEEPVVEEKQEIEEEERVVEPEFDAKHDEIVQRLNEAASKWKETGEVGLHLEAPVSLRERVKGFLSRFKREASDDVSLKLKEHVEEVVARAASRVDNPADEDKIVREEWKEVLEKMEESSSGEERREIEKIYKELTE